MDKTDKFVLPSPNFNKTPTNVNPVKTPYLTPCGMNLLSRDKQPPPMYGPRGSTIPPKFLNNRKQPQQHHHHPNKLHHHQQQQYHHQKKQQYQKNTYVNNGQNGSDRQYCETCEMELQSMDDLRIHKSQHEPCPVDVCKFRGHPSVMDKHVLDLHASGLFDKIKKLSTPEEIAAWREERRKRYPTVANVEMKAKAKEQRQQRGERLEENKQRFGHPNDRQRTKNHPKNDKAHDRQNSNEYKGKAKNWNGNGNGNGNRNETQNQSNKYRNPSNRTTENPSQYLEKHTNVANCTQKPTDLTENLSKRKEVRRPVGGPLNSEESLPVITKFKGTKRMKDYVHVKTKKPNTYNPLTSLLAAYCSDEDDEGEETEDSSSESNCNDSENDVPKEISKTDIPQISQINENINNAETNEAKDDSNASIEPSKLPHSNETGEIICDASTKSETEVIEQQDNETSSLVMNPEYSKEIALKTLQQTCETQASSENVRENCSSDEAPEEAPINRTSALETPELPTASNDPKAEVKRNTSTSSSRLERKRKSGLNYRNAKLRKQNTMLEKLLETEIRHERNVLLQCVRFVCQNDFFGIGSKKFTKE